MVPAANLCPPVSLPDFRDYQLRAQQFEGFAASTYASAELTGKNGSQQVDVGLVSANFFFIAGSQTAPWPCLHRR